MNFLGMFKNKESPPPPPTQQPQQAPQKGSMFGGNLKIKHPPITEQQQPISPAKVNSDIMQMESDAYKQQLNSQQLDQETPTPEVEIKQNIEEPKKKPTGFGFIKKKQQEQTQSPAKILEDEQKNISNSESHIVYGIEREECELKQQNNSQIIHPTYITEEAEKEQYVDQIDIPKISAKQDVMEFPQQNQQYEQQQQQQQLQKIPINQFKVSTPTRQQIDNSYQRQHQQLLDELSYFITETNLKKLDIFTKQQQIEQQIINYQKKLKEYNQSSGQLSIEQQVWISQDQYEKAEEIEQNLKKIQEKINHVEKTIKEQELYYQQLQDEKENIRGEEYPYYQEIEQKLEEIERQQIKYTDLYKQEQNNNIKKLQQQIEEENERVKMQQIHTEIEGQHLDNEEQQLNQIMDNQTKEYRLEYDQMFNKKQTLETEIQDLLQLLKEKQSELGKVSESLIEAKDKIKQVKQKFNQQLEKVQNKRTKLQDDMIGLAEERAQIESIENECLRKQSEFKNKQQFLTEQLESIQSQRKELTKKSNLIPEQCELEGAAAQKYNENKKECFKKFKELASVQRDIDELNYKRNLGQSQLNEIIQKKSELSHKLPKMIDDKAILVQNKNFKGASAINEQIKESQKQIQEYEEKISENQKMETNLIQQIEQIEDELILKKSSYEISLQQFEISRFFTLEIKMQEIQCLDNVDSNLLIYEIQEELKQLGEKYQEQIASIKKYNQQIGQDDNQQEDIQENKQEQELVNSEQDLQEKQENVEQNIENIENIENIVKIEENLQLEIKQQLSLEEINSQISQLIEKQLGIKQQIKDNETKMNQFAENEQYDEAEEVKIFCDQLEIQLTNISNELMQLQKLNEQQQ